MPTPYLPHPLIPDPEEPCRQEIPEGTLESLIRQIDELTVSNQQLREEVERYQATGDLLPAPAHEEWQALSRRLLAERDEEQKQISRELHDVIGQTMTGINVRLAVLRAQATAHAIEMHRQIAETERLAEKSVEVMHRFAADLHPAVLDDFGIVPALHTLAESYQARGGVPVEITAGPGTDDLSVAVGTALYRIAREALEVIASQAGAVCATVKITRSASLVRMEILDNEHGFPTPPNSSELGDMTRPGLLGMRERAVMAGGTFKLESPSGGMTILIVEIPLNHRRVAAAAAEPDVRRDAISTPSLT